MLKSLLAAVYTALVLSAIPASAADGPDIAALEALREGDMKKLVFHAEPRTPLEGVLIDAQEVDHALSEYRGKYVLLNFWATWCAPCRKEMPMLAEVQDAFAGPAFEVVTLATGRNSVAGIAGFFDKIGVTNLPQYRDRNQELARAAGVLGLPITLLLDPEGREIARLQGDATWNSNSAMSILRSVTTSLTGTD